MGLTLWNDQKDSRESLAGLELRVGAYEFVFDTTIIPNAILPDAKKHKGREFDIAWTGGPAKRARVDEIVYINNDDDTQTMLLRLSLLENPLPALAVILGAAAIVGVVAIVLLKEIRVFATKSPIFFGGLLLLGGAAFYYMKVRK